VEAPVASTKAANSPWETGRDAIVNENGAGRVPRHPGYYDYKIEPPVSSATKITGDRKIN